MKYLNDFATTYQLNIQYNTNITRVEKDSQFYLTDQEGTTYTCSVVVVRLVCATSVLGCRTASPFGVGIGHILRLCDLWACLLHALDQYVCDALIAVFWILDLQYRPFPS